MANDKLPPIRIEFIADTAKIKQQFQKFFGTAQQTANRTRKALSNAIPTKRINRQIKGLRIGLSRLRIALSKTARTFTSLKIIAGAFLAGFGGVRFIELARNVSETEFAFRGLTRTLGVDALVALQGFRRAAKGTINDLELMRSVNNAVILGVADTTDKFNKLIEAGRRLGRATGRTASEGFNDLAVGIGRQSRQILDNLGIVVKAEDAYERFAKKIGKAKNELTGIERRQAFQTAAFAAIDIALLKVGDDFDTFGDRVARFVSNFQNFFQQLSRNVTPALGRLFESLNAISEKTGGISAKLGAVISGLVDTVTSFFDQNGDQILQTLEKLTSIIAKFASVVKGISIEVFEAIKDLFGGDPERISNLFGIITAKLNLIFLQVGASFLSFVVNNIDKLTPFLASLFRGLADGFIRGMSLGIRTALLPITGDLEKKIKKDQAELDELNRDLGRTGGGQTVEENRAQLEQVNKLTAENVQKLDEVLRLTRLVTDENERQAVLSTIIGQGLGESAVQLELEILRLQRSLSGFTEGEDALNGILDSALDFLNIPKDFGFNELAEALDEFSIDASEEEEGAIRTARAVIKQLEALPPLFDKLSELQTIREELFGGLSLQNKTFINDQAQSRLEVERGIGTFERYADAIQRIRSEGLSDPKNFKEFLNIRKLLENPPTGFGDEFERILGNVDDVEALLLSILNASKEQERLRFSATDENTNSAAIEEQGRIIANAVDQISPALDRFRGAFSLLSGEAQEALIAIDKSFEGLDVGDFVRKAQQDAQLLQLNEHRARFEDLNDAAKTWLQRLREMESREGTFDRLQEDFEDLPENIDGTNKSLGETITLLREATEDLNKFSKAVKDVPELRSLFESETVVLAASALKTVNTLLDARIGKEQRVVNAMFEQTGALEDSAEEARRKLRDTGQSAKDIVQDVNRIPTPDDPRDRIAATDRLRKIEQDRTEAINERTAAERRSNLEVDAESQKLQANVEAAVSIKDALVVGSEAVQTMVGLFSEEGLQFFGAAAGLLEESQEQIRAEESRAVTLTEVLVLLDKVAKAEETISGLRGRANNEETLKFVAPQLQKQVRIQENLKRELDDTITRLIEQRRQLDFTGRSADEFLDLFKNRDLLIGGEVFAADLKTARAELRNIPEQFDKLKKSQEAFLDAIQDRRAKLPSVVTPFSADFAAVQLIARERKAGEKDFARQLAGLKEREQVLRREVRLAEQFREIAFGPSEGLFGNISQARDAQKLSDQVLNTRKIIRSVEDDIATKRAELNRLIRVDLDSQGETTQATKKTLSELRSEILGLEEDLSKLQSSRGLELSFTELQGVIIESIGLMEEFTRAPVLTASQFKLLREEVGRLKPVLESLQGGTASLEELQGVRDRLAGGLEDVQTSGRGIGVAEVQSLRKELGKAVQASGDFAENMRAAVDVDSQIENTSILLAQLKERLLVLEGTGDKDAAEVVKFKIKSTERILDDLLDAQISIRDVEDERVELNRRLSLADPSTPDRFIASAQITLSILDRLIESARDAELGFEPLTAALEGYSERLRFLEGNQQFVVQDTSATLDAAGFQLLVAERRAREEIARLKEKDLQTSKDIAKINEEIQETVSESEIASLLAERKQFDDRRKDLRSQLADVQQRQTDLLLAEQRLRGEATFTGEGLLRSEQEKRQKELQETRKAQNELLNTQVARLEEIAAKEIEIEKLQESKALLREQFSQEEQGRLNKLTIEAVDLKRELRDLIGSSGLDPITAFPIDILESFKNDLRSAGKITEASRNAIGGFLDNLALQFTTQSNELQRIVNEFQDRIDRATNRETLGEPFNQRALEEAVRLAFNLNSQLDQVGRFLIENKGKSSDFADQFKREFAQIEGSVNSAVVKLTAMNPVLQQLFNTVKENPGLGEEDIVRLYSQAIALTQDFVAEQSKIGEKQKKDAEDTLARTKENKKEIVEIALILAKIAGIELNINPPEGEGGKSFFDTIEARFQSIGSTLGSGISRALRNGESTTQVFVNTFGQQLDQMSGLFIKEFVGDFVTKLGGGLAKTFKFEGSGAANAFSGAILGAISLGFAISQNRSDSSIENVPVEELATSSEAVRGVIAGPTSVAIAEVGSALREANRGVEGLLVQIRDLLSGQTTLGAVSGVGAVGSP